MAEDSGMDKYTVPEIAPLVKALYATEHGSVGGHLHVVLDDDNIDTSHVEYCIQSAESDRCSRCYALGLILRQMSKTQRSKLARMAYEPNTDGWD